MRASAENIFLLGQLIKFRENDMVMDMESGYCTENEVRIMDNLIRSVTRYVNDIRYCSRKNCPCSPEYDIKIWYEKIGHFLRKTNTALHHIPWKTIESIISEGTV